MIGRRRVKLVVGRGEFSKGGKKYKEIKGKKALPLLSIEESMGGGGTGENGVRTRKTASRSKRRSPT